MARAELLILQILCPTNMIPPLPSPSSPPHPFKLLPLLVCASLCLETGQKEEGKRNRANKNLKLMHHQSIGSHFKILLYCVESDPPTSLAPQCSELGVCWLDLYADFWHNGFLIYLELSSAVIRSLCLFPRLLRMFQLQFFLPMFINQMNEWPGSAYKISPNTTLFPL
jgi:hypothetical protein